MNDLREALRRELVTRFRVPKADLEDSTPLFSSGLIDSLSVMELVFFVEQQIGAPIPPTGITLEHFDSVELITVYAESLAQAEAAAPT
jgi:acyl carrier protein